MDQVKINNTDMFTHAVYVCVLLYTYTAEYPLWSSVLGVKSSKRLQLWRHGDKTEAREIHENV